jgi:putative pyruvate formate lyase activating enzyme
MAEQKGLTLPIVYNTGRYDALDTLTSLEGLIDIYMPDMKYSQPEIGKRYSGVPDYPKINQIAVREMYRQVGDLKIDPQGIAIRGLLVRHLVLPENLAGSRAIFRFLREEISASTYLNIMDQYRPAYHGSQYPPLNRRLSRQEYDQVVDMAREQGLFRLDRG